MHQAGLSVAHVFEQRRVETHLRGAERLARRRHPRLDPLRARNRALLLDELARYRKAGRFPHNHEFRNELVPHFVDAHGTRCALAHLLDISGQPELVREIATYRNNAHVRELSNDAELVAWLKSAGLSLEEAARIQPAYCHITHAEACFCSPGGPAPVVALGTILGTEGGGLVRVRIERVDGSPTSVVPGDEVSAGGSGSPGALTLLSGTPGRDGGAISFQQISPSWTVTTSTATCTDTAFSQAHPVPIETAIAALRSPRQECQALLNAEDLGWRLHICEDNSGGCQLVASSLDAPAITSVAVFSALLAYRRLRAQKRRASARRP